MSVQYMEPNFDFDFDFLIQDANISVQAPDKVDRFERARKQMLIVKKKVVSTNLLIGKYYYKKDEGDEFERTLQITKEECKQICLEFRNIQEKYQQLEKELESLRLSNAELQEKYYKSESRCGAVQSHANQLQILVQEKENTIASLTTKSHLQKGNVKNTEKKVLVLKKENADLIKDICLMRDIIYGKRKLSRRTKLIVKKYDKIELSDDEGTEIGDESDSDIENHCVISPTKIQKLTDSSRKNNNKGLGVASKDDNDHDSDCSNGLTSADTGRGSSLASSDGDKCYNSPDYFLNHSPINPHCENEKINYNDATTSPIDSSQNTLAESNPVHSHFETIQIILSPVNIDQKVNIESRIEPEIITSIPRNEHVHKDDETNSMNEDRIIKPTEEISMRISNSPYNNSGPENVIQEVLSGPVGDRVIKPIACKNISKTSVAHETTKSLSRSLFDICESPENEIQDVPSTLVEDAVLNPVACKTVSQSSVTDKTPTRLSRSIFDVGEPPENETQDAPSIAVKDAVLKRVTCKAVRKSSRTDKTPTRLSRSIFDVGETPENKMHDVPSSAVKDAVINRVACKGVRKSSRTDKTPTKLSRSIFDVGEPPENETQDAPSSAVKDAEINPVACKAVRKSSRTDKTPTKLSRSIFDAGEPPENETHDAPSSAVKDAVINPVACKAVKKSSRTDKTPTKLSRSIFDVCEPPENETHDVPSSAVKDAVLNPVACKTISKLSVTDKTPTKLSRSIFDVGEPPVNETQDVSSSSVKEAVLNPVACKTVSKSRVTDKKPTRLSRSLFDVCEPAENKIQQAPSSFVKNGVLKPTACKNKSKPIITEEISATTLSHSLFEIDESENVSQDVPSSPVEFDLNNVISDDECENNETISEKQCLEFNNSNHFNETNTGDTEIEMILNKMRFNRTLITPIPSTPSKSRNPSSVRGRKSKTSDRDLHVCKDAAQLKEDNKLILEKYSKMEREITLIKRLLQDKFNCDMQTHLGLIEDNSSCGLKTSRVNVATSIDTELIINADLNNISNAKHQDKSIKTNVNSVSILNNDLNNINCLESCKKNTTKHRSAVVPVVEKISIENPSSTTSTAILIEDTTQSVELSEPPIVTGSLIEEISETEHPHIGYHGNTNPIEISFEAEETTANIIQEKTIGERAYDKVSHSKHRKLSKLDKLRQHLIPKSKIKKNITPSINKLRIKAKPLLPPNKKCVESDTAATLNSKNVYEKAVQVMTELKSQQKLIKMRQNDSCNKSETNVTNVQRNSPKKTDLIGASIASKCSPTKHMISSDFRLEKELVVAVVKCDENSNCNFTISRSPKKQVTTDSRKISTEKAVTRQENEVVLSSKMEAEIVNTKKNNIGDGQIGTRKRQKRNSTDNQDVPCKRILRSSNLRQSTSEDDVKIASPEKVKSKDDVNVSTVSPVSNKKDDNNSVTPLSSSKNILNYSDIDMFDNNTNKNSVKSNGGTHIPNGIIFCSMLDKYGKQSKKICLKKVPDSILNTISKTLQDEILRITGMNNSEAKHAMNKLVETIQGWDLKHFMAGFMMYLKDSQRKLELFNKIASPPAPPMTKSEQVLLYVISQLKVSSSVDILNCVLCNIEYVLFKLNRTPEFDTIDSMAHFYAVLCRYFNMRSRLRLFMLDAMYCIQYKAVPLIKQCLDVWMHVLPLAHMGIAKTSLVTCLVYLLHFYKCEDRFNRVQEIRNILSRRYYYQITEWNEPKIIEMFRNAIKEIRAVPVEMKMLRIGLIVIAKRHGPKWCQKNIIKNLLLPMIEKDVPERVKIFCVSMLGPLLKPYPVDMKVHCEIAFNLLSDKLKQNPSPQLQEAIVSSLIYMGKQNQTRLLQLLLTWKPQQVSQQMEVLLRDFIMEKPMKLWKSVLSKIVIA